jgi:hypothetical protein
MASHRVIVQALNRWIQYGPRRFYYGVDNFRGSEPAWDEVPVIYAQRHPDHRLVKSDLAAALASVGGRLVGRMHGSQVFSEGSPRMESQVDLDDPVVEADYRAGRIGLSSAFVSNHDDDGRLNEVVRPNHLLVFPGADRQRDQAAMFLNRRGDEDVSITDKLIEVLHRVTGGVFSNINDCHDERGQFCSEGGGSSDRNPPSRGDRAAARAGVRAADEAMKKNPDVTAGELWSGLPGEPRTPEARVEASRMSAGASERRARLDAPKPGSPTDRQVNDAKRVTVQKIIGAATSAGDLQLEYAAAITGIALDGSDELVDALHKDLLAGRLTGGKTYGFKHMDFADADYPWDQCMDDQMAKGYSEERAKKICGSIKAKNNMVEMRAGPDGSAGSASEGGNMGDLDKIKSELDAANAKLATQTQELEAKNQALEAARADLKAKGDALTVFEQGQRDAAWANMKTKHVPKGWLAAPDEAAKTVKETDLRREFEGSPVAFANRILEHVKAHPPGHGSEQEGAEFQNQGGAGDAVSAARELRALSGR